MGQLRPLGVAEIRTNGLVTADGNGITTIAACYQGVSKAVTLTVGP